MAFNVCGNDKYQAWLKAMGKLGLIPPEVRRIIIDADVDSAVKVYYECFGDERMFNIELADALKEGAEVISVKDAKGT